MTKTRSDICPPTHNMLFCIGFALAALLSHAQMASAYTARLNQALIAYQGHETLTFRFRQLPPSVGHITVSIALHGDFGGADEYAEIQIAGQHYPKHNPKFEGECRPNDAQDPSQHKTYTAPSTIIKQGQLTIQVKTSRNVDGGQCSWFYSNRVVVRIDYISNNEAYVRPQLSSHHVFLQPNDKFLLRYHLANRGGLPAGPFEAHFYYSNDKHITTRDVLLKKIKFLGLSAGASIPKSGRATIQLRLPANIINGRRWIGMLVLPTKTQTPPEKLQTTKHNVYITKGKSKPDLRFSSINEPALRVGVGQPLPWRFSIHNNGSHARSFKVRSYLSLDMTLDAKDIKLQELSVESLAKETSRRISTTLIVPANTVQRSYYLGIVIDAENAVDEADETNNIRWFAVNVVPLPRLRFTKSSYIASAKEQALRPGARVLFTYHAENTGSTETSGQSRIQIYFSQDKILNPSQDTLIHKRRIPTLKGGEKLISTVDFFYIPDSLSDKAGYFLMGYRGEFANRVAYDPLSNSLDTPFPVQILKRKNKHSPEPPSQNPVPLPDYKVDAVAVEYKTIRSWGRIELSYRIKCDSVPIEAQRARRMIRFYASSSPHFDKTTATLIPEQWYEGRPCSPPTGFPKENAVCDTYTIFKTPVSGKGYIHFVVDANNKIEENDEANNVKSAAANFQAYDIDLSISEFRLSRSLLKKGDKVAFQYRLRNEGMHDSPGTVYGAVYYSKDPKLDPKIDIELSPNAIQSPHIAPNSFEPSAGLGKGTFTLTKELPKGKGYIIMMLDGYRHIAETNENNNTFAVPVEITEKPDLLIQDWTITHAPEAPHSLVLRYTVKNQGTNPSPPSRLALYLSIDPTRPRAGVTLAVPPKLTQLPALKAHGHIKGQLRLQLPILPSHQRSDYWLGIIVDRDNIVDECKEDNNISTKRLRAHNDHDQDGFYLNDDCNDNNDRVSPVATEICDGLDNDCDGLTDNGMTCAKAGSEPQDTEQNDDLRTDGGSPFQGNEPDKGDTTKQNPPTALGCQLGTHTPNSSNSFFVVLGALWLLSLGFVHR